MRGLRHLHRAGLLTGALLGAVAQAQAQAQAEKPASAPPVEFSLEGAVQAIHEGDAFFGLAQTFAPAAGLKRSLNWVEANVKPGLKVSHTLPNGSVAYGGVSLLATGTWGEDVFQQKNRSWVGLENAFIGLRGTADAMRWDVSAGAQPFQLGHGFLLALGAGNGFERGAAVTSPRRAWEMTAVARVAQGPFTTEAFYLDPNELKSSDSGTRLWGARAEWSPDPSLSLGLAHIKVHRSDAPWPQAPVTIIEGGRKGVETTDLIWRWEPKSGALAGLSLLGEAAWQRNDGAVKQRASGFGAEIGWRFAQAPFTPKLSWSMRRFTGDDPNTPDRLERFDPLFYDGAPNTWSSGGNGSFAFYNSNLAVHRLRLDLVLSARDFVNLNFWTVDTDQVNSPVQYGQGARLSLINGQPALISGFPKHALTQELYAEYTRVVSQNLFMTAGLAYAMPQAGIKAVVADAKDWVGALVNLSFKY